MSKLRELTAVNHKKAENMPFNLQMVNGQLSQTKYYNYLLQQREIFKELEKHPLPHQDLNRLNFIQEDIDELSNVASENSLVLNSTKNYTNYLSEISKEQLQAHIYLNYLAIAYGGQFLKTKVPSKGQMYNFNSLSEAVHSIRRIQTDDWVEEVNKGYEFIIDIFKELEA